MTRPPDREVVPAARGPLGPPPPDPVSPDPLSPDPVSPDAVSPDLVSPDAVWPDPGPSGPAAPVPALSGPTLSGPTLSGPTLSGPTLSGPALSGQVQDGVVVRRAARVLLVDAEDRVLLLRGTDPTDPSGRQWWFTPGGGLDEAEQPLDAARRELAEETGLLLAPEALAGPVHARTAEFTFTGVRCRQDEVYFLARVDRHDVDRSGLTPLEVHSVLGSRWWPRSDLARTQDTVYPADLSDVLERVLGR